MSIVLNNLTEEGLKEEEDSNVETYLYHDITQVEHLVRVIQYLLSGIKQIDKITIFDA